MRGILEFSVFLHFCGKIGSLRIWNSLLLLDFIIISKLYSLFW